jgi:hypothetical protein
MQTLDDAAYGELAQSLRERVAALAPGWTDDNASDPAVVLVELFAFLTESLLYRENVISERGRASAARLATFARALAARNTDAAGHTLERPRYFAGQLLGVEDFQLEQDYIRQRLRRLNREVLGWGVVHGLDVSIGPDDSGPGDRVVVAPGFAIDGYGEEIELCGPATAGLPQTAGPLYVTLHHAERPTRRLPAANGNEFSRIEEGFAIRVEAAPTGPAVVLARLLHANARWRVDETYRPTRAGAFAR